MSKHTEGPWAVTATDDFRVNKGRVTIAFADYAGLDYQEAMANARLIALCPEMFEYIESSAMNGCATAQALIAKATGA